MEGKSNGQMCHNFVVLTAVTWFFFFGNAHFLAVRFKGKKKENNKRKPTKTN